ncbi:hypothetical protein K439DRAFT_1631942 [Ramaria rubella]|nr:hypothetical protein K439DRAFT_1631942 [Ramaria rubella]
MHNVIRILTRGTTASVIAIRRHRTVQKLSRPIQIDSTLNSIDGMGEAVPPYCPYFSGARLALRLISEEAGESSRPFRATIIHAFLPYTNSQTLKVRVSDHDIVGLPQTLVLKLSDRRFVERGYGEGNWSPSCEVSLRRDLPPVPPAVEEFPEDPDERQTWQFEFFVWNRLQEALQNEINIYRRFDDLQRKHIPRFYGKVELDIVTELEAPQIVRCVQGIALEYIHGPQLDNLKQLNIPADECERLSQAALDIVRTLRKREVLHEDVRSANILVRTSDMSPFLIDFGHARARQNETDEEWSEAAFGAASIMSMRILLWRHGLHDLTPSGSLPPDPLHGYLSENSEVESNRHTQAWRDKYWEPVELGGPTYKIIKDDEGKEYKYHFNRWRPKGKHVTLDDC